MGSRLNAAEQCSQGFEADALASFSRALQLLRDPRRGQGRRYPLPSVVVSALMAIVCGCDDAEAMALWAGSNEEFLAKFLSLPHGAPSQDVYLRVLGALDPHAFRMVFLRWIELLRLHHALAPRQLAVDGKTSRGSRDAGADRGPVHMLNAWAVEDGVVVGQLETSAKSNEITALPELLRLLDLRNTTVSIDAIGCQRKIAHVIVERHGNYLLSVKNNQPALHESLCATFEHALGPPPLACEQDARPAVETYEEVDKGHGRLEVRRVHICKSLALVPTAKRWKRLAVVVMVQRERTELRTGKTSQETAYYICSDENADAPTIARMIRNHWHVENRCHWVLDLAFREDAARHRAANAAANFTILRHCALNLLARDTTQKVGIANRRKLAAWSREYLLHVLSNAAS